VYLRAAAFYQERKVTLHLGVRATRIDPKAHTVTMSTGETVQYDKLLIATGSRARRLDIPGSDLAGIHYLRTVTDVDAIRAGSAPARTSRSPAGATSASRSRRWRSPPASPLPCSKWKSGFLKRVTTPAMSAFYHGLHAGRGVNVRTSTKVSGFAGKDGHVEAVLTETGERIPADLVIVGVGIIPNTELASEAGIACDNGILVDDHCRTSDPDIYAAGDCTNHPNALLGRRLRLESVPNAMEQARVATANMNGGDATYASIPWFWSDQYELKLQMVGFSSDGDTAVGARRPRGKPVRDFYLKGRRTGCGGRGEQPARVHGMPADGGQALEARPRQARRSEGSTQGTDVATRSPRSAHRR
jgi:3-phenylpropionate/trans-cinnamate dioxygenase ferredoxin reductase subunit